MRGGGVIAVRDPGDDDGADALDEDLNRSMAA